MNSKEQHNIFDLKEDHKSILGKYVTFFKLKQDKLINEIKMSVDDFTSEK